MRRKLKMMTKDEALKMAIEAFKTCETYNAYEIILVEKALNACKEALAHRNQWISVEDRLPDDNDFVLVHYAEFMTTKELDWEWTDEYSRYVVAKYIEEFEQWCFEDSSGDLTELNAPSHWQPLPEPPKE